MACFHAEPRCKRHLLGSRGESLGARVPRRRRARACTVTNLRVTGEPIGVDAMVAIRRATCDDDEHVGGPLAGAGDTSRVRHHGVAMVPGARSSGGMVSPHTRVLLV